MDESKRAAALAAVRSRALQLHDVLVDEAATARERNWTQWQYDRCACDALNAGATADDLRATVAEAVRSLS